MENRFTITRALFYEGMLCVSRDKKTTKRVLLVVSALWLLLFIFTLCTKGSLLMTLPYLLAIALAGIWIVFLMPRYYARRAWKNLKNGSMERFTRFYDDSLQINAEELQKTIPYTEIAEIRQSKRLLILLRRNDSGVLLALDGFSGGTAEDVKTLIERAKKKELSEHD